MDRTGREVVGKLGQAPRVIATLEVRDDVDAAQHRLRCCWHQKCRYSGKHLLAFFVLLQFAKERADLVRGYIGFREYRIYRIYRIYHTVLVVRAPRRAIYRTALVIRAHGQKKMTATGIEPTTGQ